MKVGIIALNTGKLKDSRLGSFTDNLLTILLSINFEDKYFLMYREIR